MTNGRSRSAERDGRQDHEHQDTLHDALPEQPTYAIRPRTGATGTIGR
jgi:hypothetical protein